MVSCSTLSFFGSLLDHAWSSHVPVSCESSGPSLECSRTRFGRPSSSEAGGAWDHGRLVSPRGPVSRSYEGYVVGTTRLSAHHPFSFIIAFGRT